MRKQLNVKFLGYLAGATVLLGTGVHCLHAHQVRRNATALLSQATRAEDADQPDRAADDLRLYLGLVPGDTDALARYGLLLDKLATTYRARLRALAVLQQVLMREPERHDIRRRLADTALKLERFSDAREHWEVLLRASPENAELEHLLGRCEEGNGQFLKAAAWFQTAVGHDPARIDSYERHAHLLRHRLGKPQTADALMDEMVDQKNPRSSPARLARAKYLKELALLAERAAERDALLERAARDVTYALVELAPDGADVLAAAADLARAEGQLAADPAAARRHFDDARSYLGRGIQAHPKEVHLHLALARLELETGRRPEAVVNLRDALGLTAGQPEELWNVATMLIDAGETAEARTVIDRLRLGGSPPATLDYLEARLLVQGKKWYQASKLLERIRPGLARLPELTVQTDIDLGQCYEQLGNPDLQLAAYRRAAATDAPGMAARVGVASALLAMGRTDEALDEYRAIIPRAPAARVVVARLLVLRNLRLTAAERRWDEVERLLDEAARAGSPSAHVPILRAEVLVAQGKVADARKLLEAVREQQPREVEVWTALADVAERQGDPAESLRLLDEAERQLGASVELCVARSRHWAKRPGAEARRVVAGLEGDLRKFAGEARPSLLRELGNAYLRLGDARGAERVWTQWAELQPDQLYVRLLLFDLALQAGDEAALQRILEEIRTIEGGDGALWHYGEAARLVLLARQGDKDRRLGAARAHLADVAARRPAWARAPLLEAGLEELADNLDRAVDGYLRAIELGNRQPGVIRRVVQLLYDRRRYAEAEQVIRKLLEQDQAPVSGDLGRLAAEIALRNQQHERALELAGHAVAADSRDYRDHVWLGQILWALGRQTQAEEALRHAVTLADTVPDTWVALVQYLARTSQEAKAEATIQEARRKFPADRAALALAQCYEAIALRDQAEEQYRAALAARPDAAVLRTVADFYLRGGEPGKAEPHLRQLTDARGQTPPGDAAWARRNLAVALALRGDYRQVQDAQVLVEQNLAGGRGTVQDQRARAVVLAMQPGRRREAIRLFESLLRGQVPTPDEQFLLARLYEADRDWPKARDRMVSLLTSPQGASPLHLAHYIRSLLARGETSEAAGWLARLEKLEPGTVRTVEIKARVFQAKGQDTEAVALLKAHAQRHADDIGSVAGLLDQLGQTAAEEMYRKNAAESRQPGSVLALAEYLGRHGRVPEALDLCERAWLTCPPEAAATISVAVLRAGQADGRQCQRVERRIREAIGQRPEGASLFVALGEVLDLQARYADAVAAYRQALQRDSHHVLALNNLAWLLTLHSDQAAESLELVNRALAIAGPIADLLDTRAVVYLLLGQANAAVKDLESAAAEAPSAVQYFHLARAYQLARNRRAAGDALQKAQAAGLKETSLHPLERAAYDRLLGDLARK